MAKKKTKVTAEKIASIFGGYSGKAVKAIEKRKKKLAKQMKAMGMK
jgi:hypothetical protein